MKLIVDGIADGVAATVTVEDADTLTVLSVELRDCPPGVTPALPGDLGRIEGGHAYLRVPALRALVPAPRSCSWDERFGQAMTYAISHGWTDETGTLVRAHIERPGSHAAPTAPGSAHE